MPGSGRAHGAGLQRLAAQGAGHHRRRLGQAVALVDRDAGRGGERVDHLGTQRRRAGQHQPDRTEPLGEVVQRQPVGEDGRGDRQHAAGLVLDEVEHGDRVEPLDQQQPGPVPQHAAEDGVEAVDVEERKDAEHDVVTVDHRRLDRGDLLDVGQQRAVGEHRGARTTRRAAGVEEGGELLGVLQRRDRAGLAGEEVVVADLPGSAPVADRHDPGVHGAGDEVLVEHRRVAVERRVRRWPPRTRTAGRASSSAMTRREPESAIIRASSSAVERGLTGTATTWARSTPR